MLRLAFARSRLEAQINRTLVLHISAYGDNDIAIVNCTQLPLKVTFERDDVFKRGLTSFSNSLLNKRLNFSERQRDCARVR